MARTEDGSVIMEEYKKAPTAIEASLTDNTQMKSKLDVNSNLNKLVFPLYSSIKDTSTAHKLSCFDLASLIKKPSIGAKEQAKALTPFDANGKTKQDAQAALFNALVIDHDHDNKIAEQIRATYDRFEVAYLAFTTSSHMQDKKGVSENRWKVVIPLDNAIEFKQFSTLSISMALLMNADLAQSRIQQVFFAPNKVSESAPYEYIEQLNKPLLNINDSSTKLIVEAKKAFDSFEAQKDKAAQKSELKPKSIKLNNHTNIIDMVNDAFDIEEVIQRFGYKYVCRRYLSPYSQSDLAGVIVLTDDKGKKRLYSHHSESDPLSNLNHNGHALDAFDTACILEHGGDFNKALNNYANMLDPDGQKKRQREYAQSNEPIAQDTIAYNALESAVEQQADPFGAHNIDLTKPHGILGAICSEILSMADRPLPLSYPLTGLHILNQLGGKRGGIGNRKINLITLVIAQTAAGKDINLQAVSQVAQTFKNDLKPWIAKPRSDVDILMNMIDRLGDCSYKIDEAHSLFQSIEDKNAASYLRNISAELLDMATTKLKEFSGNHKRDLIKTVEGEQQRLAKALEKEAANNENQESSKAAKIEDAIKKADIKMDMVINGVPNPTMNMILFSTPENIDRVANSSSIESGLIGRCLIWRVTDGRERLVWNPERSAFSEKLNQRFKAIKDNINPLSDPVTLTFDAEKMIYNIYEHYEQIQFTEHPTKGALYSRIIERVRSITSVLGIETGIATVDDVRYALAATLEHINSVEFLRRKNVAEESSGDLINHLIDLIMQKVRPAGVPQSVVKQQVLNSNKTANTNDKACKLDNKLSMYDIALTSLLNSNKVFYLDGTKRLSKA